HAFDGEVDPDGRLVELASGGEHARAGRAAFAAEISGIAKRHALAGLREAPRDGGADQSGAGDENVGHASFLQPGGPRGGTAHPARVGGSRDRPQTGSMKKYTSGAALVLYIAAAKLIFQMATAGRYGIFVDELYYVACARHLDWGYVDQPPLIALLTWIELHVFGSSLYALRFLPAIAGAGLVWLTGKLAREMGGGRFAQALAALSVACVPIYMILHHWITMNAFEPLIWLGCAWCIVRAIDSGQGKWWNWFGVLAGL